MKLILPKINFGKTFFVTFSYSLLLFTIILISINFYLASIQTKEPSDISTKLFDKVLAQKTAFDSKINKLELKEQKIENSNLSLQTKNASLLFAKTANKSGVEFVTLPNSMRGLPTYTDPIKQDNELPAAYAAGLH